MKIILTLFATFLCLASIGQKIISIQTVNVGNIGQYPANSTTALLSGATMVYTTGTTTTFVITTGTTGLTPTTTYAWNYIVTGQ